jgi:peptide/nickel transport system ATP-binding protein
MSTLIDIIDLKKYYPVGKTGIFGKNRSILKAVDNVSFKIIKGENLGLVGESGSGKTTLGRTLIHLIEPTGGEVLFNTGNTITDITKLKRNELRRQWRNMQMIFQDPYASLNQRMTVKDIIGEPLITNKLVRKDELTEKIKKIAILCGLKTSQLGRYPHAFSGGQRQRIAIARALVMNPEFIVCDEPVSALDVSIQAQILNLLKDLQKELNLTYLFIAHDLSAVAYACDRVAVMYLGKIVEMAITEKLYYTPKHPYTEALMAAIPPDDPDISMQKFNMKGEQPSPINPPSGCPFHPRCKFSDGSRCVQEIPALTEVYPEHLISCHYAESLSLKGALHFQASQRDLDSRKQVDYLTKKREKIVANSAV